MKKRINTTSAYGHAVNEEKRVSDHIQALKKELSEATSYLEFVREGKKSLEVANEKAKN